jgi:hypothetical protein
MLVINDEDIVSEARRLRRSRKPLLGKRYRKFESCSLRHAVLAAETFCYVAREICAKGGLFAIFSKQTGPEKSAS